MEEAQGKNIQEQKDGEERKKSRRGTRKSRKRVRGMESMQE